MGTETRLEEHQEENIVEILKAGKSARALDSLSGGVS
jgi:hypothetical protein